MASVHTPRQILDREFLPIRAKILEIAASLDRLHRAGGSLTDDRRGELLRRGLEVLLEPASGGQAEEVQIVFSRTYEPDWRDRLGMPQSPPTDG